jgi:hypothetical protein
MIDVHSHAFKLGYVPVQGIPSSATRAVRDALNDGCAGMRRDPLRGDRPMGNRAADPGGTGQDPFDSDPASRRIATCSFTRKAPADLDAPAYLERDGRVPSDTERGHPRSPRPLRIASGRGAPPTTPSPREARHVT